MALKNDELIMLKQYPLRHNRDFLLLWSGQTISMIGTQGSTLALPLLTLALLHSPTQAGFIAAIHFLPYLFLSLPAGALVDRWNRKRIMILCDVARCLAYGSIALAFLLGHLTVVLLYAVALIEGIAFVFFNIAEVACLPQIVSAEQLPQASALNSSGEVVGYLVGPGLAGFIISLARTTLIGAVLVYALDSISYFVSALSLNWIRTPFQAQHPLVKRVEKRSLTAEIREGLQFLWSHRRLRTLTWLTMIVNFLFSPVYLAALVLAQEQLHASANTIGLIFSISTLGGLLGAIIAPWLKKKLSFKQLMVGTIALQALGTGIIALGVSSFMLTIGGLIIFLSLPIFTVTQISYRLSFTPDILQGRVNSVFRLVTYGGQPLGTALGGLLITTIGARTELGLIAMSVALTALVGAFTAGW